MLYICTKFGQSTGISKDFRVTDLDSRVDTRVVVNVDRCTNRWKTQSKDSAMPEAGETKRVIGPWGRSTV